MQYSVAVLGAGMMGTAIAAAHLRCRIAVRLYDSVEAAIQTAPKRIAEELRLQEVPFDASLLTCCREIDAVLDCPIVIETITEKLKAKQKLYRILQNAVQNAAQNAVQNSASSDIPLLFSNTSTISISALADGVGERRNKFCGFHFFHPVRQRSLLEIIPGQETASETVEAARQHALRIEKQPIVVGDGPGFLVNRILNPYLTSALTMLADGVAMRRIERLATDFGMKMGPFRIMDEIGLDVVLHAGWVLFKAFPDRVPDSPLLLRLVEQGRLGRKTGRGFMIYPNSISWDGNGVPDPEFDAPDSSRSQNQNISDEEIVRRLFVPMYDEALRCRNDGIIVNLADADLASIHALGFPAEKGGIVSWGRLNQ